MELDIHENAENVTALFGAKQVISDYRLAFQSRQASILGRKEVLSGKAKFGIFGDGKELPQLAMARAFRPGDIRSGYYRDQTFSFAVGTANIKQFFAQLYANPDLEAEPHSGGRQMNSHFASRHFDENGDWLDLTQMPLSAPDASPTASQMPRLVGLAQASKLFRQVEELQSYPQFSHNGDEIAFGTIGNASCAEGHFWETVNALGVIQAPMVLSIWDDDYGISVPNEFQVTNDLTNMLEGFRRNDAHRGFEIYTVVGWDYEALVQTYLTATHLTRTRHIPSIIHVIEVTQPQGHSTSGSHERYKSAERLKWERAHDCLLKMREYILKKEMISEESLLELEEQDIAYVRQQKEEAWLAYQTPIKAEHAEFLQLLTVAGNQPEISSRLQPLLQAVRKQTEYSRRELMVATYQALRLVRGYSHPSVDALKAWYQAMDNWGKETYGSHLYSESPYSPLHIREIKPIYAEKPPLKTGFNILNLAFEELFQQNPRLLAFGEDVGKLGDVNQGFAGLQEKFGALRISDTGIRESTIIGQAIGLAMRGLRPIAEIQYLDYLLYGLQTLSDDLATLHYRTRGGQKAPAIIRTRGHRLEGIWHSGSPLGMMLHALRGIHILVPRNMTQAVGFYHTLLEGDDPAIVIEVLNGYRFREPMPENLHEIRTPLGIPEVIRPGTDLSLVTYGACCRIAMEAATELSRFGIEIEVIDVRSLLPFDRNHLILQSLQKTNRILFVDEDVPGGASAYMMQEVLEKQGGYAYLDSAHQTLSGAPHRPAYGDDGDYWSKPQMEHIFQAVYRTMNEADPIEFPSFT